MKRLRSFALMDLVQTDDEEELEFFDARSTAGQSDSTFFSARNHGSSRNSCSAAASNADAGSVAGCNFTSRAADPTLDDPTSFQTESDVVTDEAQPADLQGCSLDLQDCRVHEVSQCMLWGAEGSASQHVDCLTVARRADHVLILR